MSERNQLSILGEAFERLALEERLIARDAINDGRFENEEPTVHPSPISTGLLVERANPGRDDLSDCLIRLNVERSEPSQGLDRRHRRQLSVGPMKIKEPCEVDVGNAVAIGQHEGLAAKVPADTL